MNYIQQYHKEIKAGRIVTSKKVAAVYEYLVYHLKDKQSEYKYDNKKALHVIDFIETFCKHGEGKLAGKPFILELWQKALLSALFGFVHKKTGYRQFRELILIVARKNGKSVLASAIALYLLYADKEAGAQLYSAATKKDQAKIIWESAKKMVNKSPQLKRHSKIYINEIKCDIGEGTFKPLSSESNTLDGLNVHASFIDELHAIKDKNLYDVLVDGMSARLQPLSIITSTSGMIRDNIYDLKYDECSRIINRFLEKDYTDVTVLPIVYELDNRNEIDHYEAWIKANPNLGVSKQISYLEHKVQAAKEDNRLLPNLLCKDFNIPVNGNTAYFDIDTIINEDTFNMKDMRNCYYIGGWDLSQQIDLTSACMLFKKESSNKIYVKSMYFIPEDRLAEYEARDNKPYTAWYNQGLIRLTKGKNINSNDVLEWYIEMQEKYGVFPFKYGYDTWGSAQLTEALQMQYGKDICEEVRQGKKTLSIPMQRIKNDIEDKLINYNNNPITIWNLACVEADTDINGNIQPAKNRNKNGIRIDGFAAILNAYTIYLNNQEEYSYMNLSY